MDQLWAITLLSPQRHRPSALTPILPHQLLKSSAYWEAPVCNSFIGACSINPVLHFRTQSDTDLTSSRQADSDAARRANDAIGKNPAGDRRSLVLRRYVRTGRVLRRVRRDGDKLGRGESVNRFTAVGYGRCKNGGSPCEAPDTLFMVC